MEMGNHIDNYYKNHLMDVTIKLIIKNIKLIINQ